jgi:cytochrome c oxidase assembly protein subunit 15
MARLDFTKIARNALIAIYMIFVAGAVVRTTGSGMGCPDWPMCFGRLIPPTSESQLPENWKEDYAKRQAEKTEKFAKYFDGCSCSLPDELRAEAESLRNDKSRLDDVKFNVAQTYTEYINRLVGAVSGIFVFLMLILSFRFWKTDRIMVWLCLLQVFLIGFQAWMGSIVVATNLVPWVITLHMVMGLIIIALQIYIITRSKKESDQTSSNPTVFYLLIGVTVVSMAQVIMGTQVRQEIDVLSEVLASRSQWIEQLSSIFKVHRTFSLLVIGLNGWLIYRMYQLQLNWKWGKWLLSILILEVISGIVMAYFNIPVAMQPVHMLMASLMFGIQFYLLIRFSGKRA